MSKVEAVTIQVPAGNVNSHKNGLRKRKFQKIQPPGAYKPGNWSWGTKRSGTPLRCIFGSEIENSL